MTNNETKELKPEVQSIEKVFNLKNLSIPVYQRPYKWSLKHVNQLLDDLMFHMDKGVERYRVGTVVLHQDVKGMLNIVDGQQRLVTFSLISHFLGKDKEGKSGYLKWLENKDNDTLNLLDSRISRTNLQNNYAAITQKLGDYGKRDDLKNFVLKSCEFVVVTLSDISEAFQFFDSQNARGKSLEPYDLLKAYHLREMQGCTEQEKLQCVKQWEKAIQKDELKPLFNEYLYRIRKWLRGESAFYFRKEDVDIFKGISVSDLHNYPYLRAYEVMDFYVSRNERMPMSQMTYPFQLNQTIINGKRFFEYVEYYRELLVKVRNSKHEMFDTLNEYEGRHRTGDLYTRNLFQAALLLYVDKFGEAQMDEAIRVAFLWAYTIRLENKAVRLATMDNKALGPKSMLKVILHALHPKEVLSFPYTKATKNNASKVGAIAEYFGIKGEGNE